MIGARVIRRNSYILGVLLLFVVLSGIPGSGQAALMATFEDPAEGQDVAGVSIIRGWAFSDTTGVHITQVNLLIDGTVESSIPCCSTRQDVADANQSFPAENTLNSGFGITFNYGRLSEGPHTIGVTIQDSSGAQFNETHTAKISKPGGFEFLDLVDLASASVQRQGQDLLLSGVRVLGDHTQQAKLVTARLRWLQSRQALGLVETTIQGAASSLQKTVTAVQAAQGSELYAINASLESPGNGQTASGITVIRGWAIAARGRTIQKVELSIDGVSTMTIPCCSERPDVAAVFSQEPNALNSGFGATFNYGHLASGVHTITVTITDSAESSRTFVKGVLVRQPGDFEFLDQLDFESTTVRVANGALVVEGAKAIDSKTKQTVTRLLRYRFDIASQAFLLLDDSADSVAISNSGCDFNGDVSSLNALKQNSGGDGISLPEAIQAINNTGSAERTLVDWSVAGEVSCADFLPAVQAPMTIDGDTTGDGTQKVKLTGHGLYIPGSDVTVRGLAIQNVDYPISVQVQAGRSLSNVAIVDTEVVNQGNNTGIFVGAENGVGGQSSTLSNVLVSNNHLSGPGTGVGVSALGKDSSGGTSTLRNVTVVQNAIQNQFRGISMSPYNTALTQGSTLSQITVANNLISDVQQYDGIYLSGGDEPQSSRLGGGKNTVDALVLDNVITNANGGNGIGVIGSSETVAQNTVMVEIRGNTVQNSNQQGIIVSGGFLGARSHTVKAIVSENKVVGVSKYAGIEVEGGNADSAGHTIISEIRGNSVQNGHQGGILVTGGNQNATSNMVDVTVAENSVTNGGDNGIHVYGGFEAQQNTVMTTLQSNTVQGNNKRGILLSGGWSASDNMVEAMVSDNVVRSTEQEGIQANGGTTQVQSNSMNQSAARNNLLTGMILNNQVQGSGSTSIAVFGGFDNTRGVVSGNTARKNIFGNNIPDTPRCADGIVGNHAECTFNPPSALSAQAQSLGDAQPSDVASMSVPVALAARLSAQATEVDKKVQQLQAMAAMEHDLQLRTRLLELSAQLEALRDKLAARLTGQVAK